MVMITVCTHVYHHVHMDARSELVKSVFIPCLDVPLPVKSAIAQVDSEVGSDDEAYGKGRRLKSIYTLLKSKGQYLR